LEEKEGVAGLASTEWGEALMKEIKSGKRGLV